MCIAKGGSPLFKGELGQFVHFLYADTKTVRLFGAHMRSAAFYLTARTNFCVVPLLVAQDAVGALWPGPARQEGRQAHAQDRAGWLYAESPPMPEHAPPPSGRKNYSLGALAPLLLPLLALVGLFLSLSLSS